MRDSLFRSTRCGDTSILRKRSSWQHNRKEERRFPEETPSLPPRLARRKVVVLQCFGLELTAGRNKDANCILFLLPVLLSPFRNSDRLEWWNRKCSGENDDVIPSMTLWCSYQQVILLGKALSEWMASLLLLSLPLLHLPFLRVRMGFNSLTPFPLVPSPTQAWWGKWR